MKPYRLEKSLAEPGASCDGEPAPDREAPPIFEVGFITPDIPKGDLIEDPLGDSMGEMWATGEVERWLPADLGG